MGFGKFIGINPFDLRTKPSIFYFSPSFSFSSSSNPFLAKNSYVVGEDATATRIDAAIVAQSDITAPQSDVEDDNVHSNVADNVVASIDPPYVVSSYFFGHLPQPKLTSCTGE